MTTQRKLEIFLVCVAIALAATFLKGWVLEREQRIRAEAVSDANRRLSAQLSAQIHQRDVDAAAYDARLQQQAAQVRTPQQAAQVILRYLPAPVAQPGQAAPAPETIPTVDRSQLSPELQQSLPAAPSFSLLTPQQIQQVAKDELACDATRNDLAACQANAADLSSQLRLAQQETAAWKAAAKGGTRFQRFVRTLKLVGCGAAGAGLGALAGQKSPALGATVGAGAGVTACSLF